MIATAALILDETGEPVPHLIAYGYLLSVSIDGAWHEGEDTFDFQNWRLYKLSAHGIPGDLRQVSQLFMLPNKLHRAAILVRMLAYVASHQDGLAERLSFSDGAATPNIKFMEAEILDLRDLEHIPSLSLHIHEDSPQARDIVSGALSVAALSVNYSLPDNSVRRETCPEHGRLGYVGTVAILESSQADTMLEAMKNFLSGQVIEIDLDVERENQHEKIS